MQHSRFATRLQLKKTAVTGTRVCLASRLTVSRKYSYTQRASLLILAVIRVKFQLRDPQSYRRHDYKQALDSIY